MGILFKVGMAMLAAGLFVQSIGMSAPILLLIAAVTMLVSVCGDLLDELDRRSKP